MTYSLTVFKNLFDNSTAKRMDFSMWERFEQLLYHLSERPGYKGKRGEYNPKSSPLICPAVFKEGTTRANANVIEWAGWAALDIDSYDRPVQEVMDQYKKYYHVCYSTASSTKEHPKFRMVFPLTNPVEPKDIKHFWFALNREFDSVGDEQCKDFSRMYYVPAQYPNAYNFIFTHKCDVRVDPYELMAKHPYVEKTGNTLLDKLPPEMKKAMLDYRREQATNSEIRWTSHRDCPFMNKKLVKEFRSIAHVDGTGRYRMIYKIMSAAACQAVRMKYPIQASQIADLIRGLDRETSKKYQKRALEKEADRAIEYAYKTVG